MEYYGRRDWMAAARCKRGVTQAQAAQHARVSLTFYQKLESGEKNPGLRVALDLADLLGVDVRMFVTRTPTGPIP